jgi:hypothetical protein
MPTGACARSRGGSDRSALLRARGMSGGACRGVHVGRIERGRCGSRAVAVLSEGTSGPRCDQGVLKGHPSHGYSARVPIGAHRCCGCGVVSTAERPSPLRVCSDLGDNKLTGSVSSSLSALTNLQYLCVPPSCQRRLHVRLTWVGSVGSAPSARHVWSIERGRCGSRAVVILSRGDLGHAM